MAVRVKDFDDAPSYPLPGLSYFWQDAEIPTATEWNNLAKLIELAVIARHSISISNSNRRKHINSSLIGKLYSPYRYIESSKAIVIFPLKKLAQ